jgi:hypothetical protein
VRPLAIPPGDHMVPRPARREEMRSAAFADKLKAGPVLILTVLPNEITPMGRSLSQYYTLDGLIYALFTAGTFGWLRPR